MINVGFPDELSDEALRSEQCATCTELDAGLIGSKSDNVYTLSTTLLPYSGKDKQDSPKDAYKFSLSKLQIFVEEAFGLLVSK
jgi:hypothetical protein